MSIRQSPMIYGLSWEHASCLRSGQMGIRFPLPFPCRVNSRDTLTIYRLPLVCVCVVHLFRPSPGIKFTKLRVHYHSAWSKSVKLILGEHNL